MSTLGAPIHFTWLRFAKNVLIQIAVIGALEVFWYTRERALTTADVAVVLVVAWINASMAVTWRNLRQQELSGELSLEDYRADPQAYLRGSKLHRRITVWGGVGVGVVCVVVSMML